MQFYDLKSKKKVDIPDSRVKYEVKKTKHGRTVKMAVCEYEGRKLYKIVSNK